jgi:regulator of nucleoside diphosphate kinase
MENMSRSIVLTAQDLERLQKLVADEREFGKSRDALELKLLQQELERALIVPAEVIPPSTITMNSQFLMMDLDTGEETLYSLVYPEDADFIENKISVMAPIGTAILGYQEGDEIDWQVPAGTVRLKINKIHYQPEAAGNFEL